MTISSPSLPPNATELPAVGTAPLATADIDRSCRGPVLVLLSFAALWLGLGALLAVVTAIKAHAPGFLANAAWLTYGRVRPASGNALLYGFLIQGGLAMLLWMICRLGRNLLAGAWVIIAGGVAWNIGLLLGLVGILAGFNAPYESLEMPPFAANVLFCAYVLVAAWGLINLHLRRERTLYVSQWFLLTTLLWFPWVYSTAQVLLFYLPVRGVMQAVVSGWYAHNLFELCLAPLGLASVFYFLPKLLQRPLYSRDLALFGFWFLVLFGGWGGLHRGEPLPNWLSSVSAVARVLVLVPTLALALSWYQTWRKPGRAGSDIVLNFIVVAALAYVLAALVAGCAVTPSISRLTEFTTFSMGLNQLRIHGFLAMAIFGAIYYFAPRVAGFSWPAPGLIRVHFWASLLGVVLTAAPLLVGGIIQGAGINEHTLDFMTVMRRTVPFLGTTTLGTTLLLVGYGVFIVHFGRLLAIACPCPSASLGAWRPWRRSSLLASGRGKP